MPRIKRSNAKRKRHKKWLKRAKGFRGTRSTVFRKAKEATLKAGQYAYRDRRKKKTALRSRWQVQINAASRAQGVSYSRLIHGLRKANVVLDRKVLAQLAAEHPALFEKVIEAAKLERRPAGKASVNAAREEIHPA
jgi:large subunit ribosomal protein L20